MATPEVYPFASIDDSWRYPAWIRGLRRANGVYLFRDRRTEDMAYIGESHSERLYATLTRHFQRWTDKFRTAGATYTRDEVDVAVIVVAKLHAVHLQNDLICALTPRDNRLQCEDLFDWRAAAKQACAGDDEDVDDEYDTYNAYDTDNGDHRDNDECDEYPIDRSPPADYEYDLSILVQGIDYRFPDDVPF